VPSKFLLYCFIVLVNFAALAKPKVITSITPIASIASMLLIDVADVESVNVTSGCPHHYHLRPSDKNKITNAEIVIYIDDKFDGFFSNIIADFSGKKIRISDIVSINFKDSNDKINWHFWLDLDNILALQEELTKIFIHKFPMHAKNIETNFAVSKQKITALKEAKIQALAKLTGAVILSDSLDHFFNNTNVSVIKLYQSTNGSLAAMDLLEKTIMSNTVEYLVIDSGRNPELYAKFGKPIITIDSENWSIDENDILPELFENKYFNILEKITAAT
jgi:zinc transport system substrate-binding protein